MKKKKEGRYFPLAYAEKTMSEVDTLQRWKDMGVLPKSTTLDQYIDFVTSKDFLNIDYDGPFKGINLHVFWNFEKYQEALELPEMVMEGAFSWGTELKDVFLTESVLRYWASYRKVYRIDRSFFRVLISTENVSIQKGLLARLPFPVFYIDLSDVGTEVAPFVGAFVKPFAEKDGSTDQVMIYLLAENAAVYSFYSCWIYENGIAKATFGPDIPMMEHDLITNTVVRFETDNREAALKAIVQVLLFLAASNTDQKVFQKPREHIGTVAGKRLNYRDLEIINVGFSYGKAIRLSEMQSDKALAEDMSEGKAHKSSPKRPHVRRAHWHHYRYGPGKTETKLLWNPPAFIGTGKQIPVSIQEIKE